MTKHTRSRIALGVLAGLGALDKTLARLATIGIDPAALTLIVGAGLAETDLSQLKANASPNAHGGPAVVRRTEETFEMPGLVDGASSDIARFERWATPGLTRNLDRLLAEGEWLLLVPVANTQQEAPIFEALLETSANQVQLHDV